ncbi:MAG TPA: tyrosine--tRNA ligase [Candidatus Dormibacteraeota bacterium]|nr:tyrosine--tRNA ligase [Candidatus Dormibacteraeota bacterium]
MTSPVPSTPAPTDAGPHPGLPGLLDELRWRGLLDRSTPGLPARLATGRTIAGYNGFDPTAPSLHVGHLVPVFGLLHLQRRGGRPVVVVGGATGMVGDPSGRSAERNLLDTAPLEANLAGIRRQLERFLDFTPGATGAVVVDNLDWLGPTSMLDFLRDVGKHFTIPYMLAKDSVQLRLDRGLSYTEFSYMLLQAADFLHLYRELGVELQMGGADQWGNMTAGIELIRRVEGGGTEAEPAHALCYPLLTDAGGAKFGKTVEGTSVWLDPQRTSPFAFYQWWLNTSDADVGRYLRFFTLLDRERIEALDAETVGRPEARAAQRALALDITERVHGTEAAEHAVRVSEAAFGREPIRDPDVLATLHADADGFDVPARLSEGSNTMFLADTGLLTSRSEARRMIAGGGVRINFEPVTDPEAEVARPIAGEWWHVAIGRRVRRVGRLRRDDPT